jgi:hypothetical protein
MVDLEVLLNFGVGAFGMWLMYSLTDKHLSKIYTRLHNVELTLIKFIESFEKKK